MYFLKGWDMATHSFNCKQAIPACLYSPAAEHHRHLAGTQFTVPRKVIVDLGDWLRTEIKWRPRESNTDTVTHPSTNRTRRKLTSLSKTNAIPLRQVYRHLLTYKVACVKLNKYERLLFCTRVQSRMLNLTSGYATWFTVGGAIRIAHYDSLMTS